MSGIKEINGMHIQIQKSWYNKTKVQPDGITHVVDTEHSYPVYQFGMAKNYFDIEDKNAVIDLLISDLKGVAAELERLKEKETTKTENQIDDREL